MMTPDERYALQRARDALEDALATIKSITDPGENPHIGDEYVARLKEGATTGTVCLCDFGWQPECPAHRDTAARYMDPGRPAEAPSDAFIEDHQRTSYHPDASPAVVAPPTGLPPLPAWYGQVDTDTEDDIIADHQGERPADGFIRTHFPAVADNALAASMSDEQIDRFLGTPASADHKPTPADVFGKKDQ